jgi:3-phenylpropionate/trans-cinnamate dioxygenase ferredoxin subunit
MIPAGVGMVKVNVAKRSEIAPGTMKGVEANGRKLVLANVDGRFWAMEGICSHRGGRLAEGTLEGANVICPVHHSTYDIRTGKVVRNVKIPLIGKASDLTVYNVSIEGEDIAVDVPANP